MACVAVFCFLTDCYWILVFSIDLGLISTFGIWRTLVSFSLGRLVVGVLILFIFCFFRSGCNRIMTGRVFLCLIPFHLYPLYFFV